MLHIFNYWYNSLFPVIIVALIELSCIKSVVVSVFVNVILS